MQEKVKLPATLLIVAASISILVALASLGLNIVGMAGGGMRGMHGMGGGNEQMMQMMSGGVGIATAAISLVLQGVIIFGAMKMMALQSYNLALAAAVLASIPCFGCCLVNMPVGIWCLVTLMDAGVKAAFDGGMGAPPMAGAPPTMPGAGGLR